MSYPRQNNHFCSLCLPHNIFQDYKIETVSSYVSREASSLFNKWGKKIGLLLLSLLPLGQVCCVELKPLSIGYGEKEKRTRLKNIRDTGPCIFELVEPSQEPSLPTLLDSHEK